MQTDIGVGNLKLENLKLETNTGTRVRGRYLCAVFGEVGIMKKIVNVMVTLFLMVLKYGVCAPIYLLYAPVVTALRWGGIRKLRYSLPFEVRCVWDRLREDWHEWREAIVFRA